MNQPLWVPVALQRLVCLLASGLFLNACSGESWKEEVLLHNGQKIIVERTVDRGGRHEVGQEPPIITQTLRFKLPTSGKEIEWKTEISHDIGLADFQPMNVDIFANNAYLVAWPVGCLAYNKWGRPNPPYIVFKHAGAAWQQIPMKDLPPEITRPNIIFGSPDTNAKKLGKGTITAAGVQGVNGRLVGFKANDALNSAANLGFEFADGTQLSASDGLGNPEVSFSAGDMEGQMSRATFENTLRGRAASVDGRQFETWLQSHLSIAVLVSISTEGYAIYGGARGNTLKAAHRGASARRGYGNDKFGTCKFHHAKNTHRYGAKQ